MKFIRILLTISLIGIVSAVVGACATDPVKSDGDTCSVTPPDNTKSDMSAALEAALDLKNFATLPAEVNFKSEVKKTVDRTFQKVPDSVAACAMLNQTYVCITDQIRAGHFLQFMKESGQCDK